MFEMLTVFIGFMSRKSSSLFSLLLAGGMSFSCIASTWGQITVDESMTAQEVVETILLGEGVEIFNVTYSGDLDQIGSFEANNSNILINDGMVLATGSASNVIGPNTSGSSTIGGGNFGIGDPDLTLLSTFETNDAAVLEFDFIPTGDSISFNYSFGSDEYNEYVCGSVNDAFGFFLSGPGITGPYSNNSVNLAVIPDTDGTPVTINSVNNGTVGSAGTASNCAQVDINWTQNTEFYIDNATNSDPAATQLDGFTVVLTAASGVQCGGTYHIKIAIADAGDTAYDSAVFIEGGSFSSNSFDIVATASVSGNMIFLGDTTVVETCNDAMFQVVRPSAATEDTIQVTISGTATNGVDYELIDPEVIMVVGQFSFDIPVIVIPDAIAESPETVTIEYLYINLCGDSVFRAATLAIHDFEPTILEFESPVGICQGQAILEVNPISGYGPFEFLWDTGAADTLAVNTVITNDPGSADVVVTDVCGNEVEATVDYTQPLELIAFISQLNEPLCAGDSVYLQSEINTGVGPFEYDWSTGGDDPTELVNFNSSTLVTLTITDPCGTEDVITFDVEIPVYEPITGAEDDVCIGLQADLSLEGGTGEYTFFAWQYSNYDSDGIPLDSTWVEVNAALDSLVTFIGPFGNYQSTVQQGEMDVWVIDQCGSEAQFTIFLVACDTEIPNVFSPNNDTTNDFFRIPGIEGFPNSGLEVYNRWGNLIFQDNDYKGGWDGNVNGNPVSEGTYYYILKRSDDENFYGPLTIVRQRR